VIREPGGSLVVTEVMLSAETGRFSSQYIWTRNVDQPWLLLADKKEAIQALLGALTTSYPSMSDTPHLIDLPHTSRLYKALLQGGHFSHGTSSISLAPASTWDRGYFAREFVRIVGKEGIVGMCTKGEGNGAFVIAELCGALTEGDEGRKERAEVKGWFNADVRREIGEGRAKGKKVLLEKIASL
jgi:pumilio family protein 6